MEELFALSRKILAEQLNIEPEKITMESSWEELSADSIDVVEMIMALEDRYDVEFPEEGLEDYPTMGKLIGSLYNYLHQEGKIE